MEEQKTFSLTTLNDLQKKIDRMPFMLVLVVCSLVIITFFVCNLFLEMRIDKKLDEVKNTQTTILSDIKSNKELIKDSIDSNEYLIEILTNK